MPHLKFSHLIALVVFICLTRSEVYAQTNWSLTGNSGTVTGTNFLGTTDNKDLDFYTNNIFRAKLAGNGNFLLGNNSDNGNKLQVTGDIMSTGTLKANNAQLSNNGRLTFFPGDVATSCSMWMDALQGNPAFIQAYNGNMVTGVNIRGLMFASATDGTIVGGFFRSALSGATTSDNAFIVGCDYGGYAPSSGNNVFNTVLLNPYINSTGGNNIVRGVYYRPLIKSMTGVTNIAFENVTGNNNLNSTSGNTLVGTSTDNGNKLQVNGNIHTTGFILPTNAAAGKVLTSDANGEATWKSPAAGGAVWNLTGNAGTTTANNFIGTTDNQSFNIRTSNVNAMTVLANGNIGIGTSDTKGYKLGVAGNIITEKLVVKLVANWSDYVFENTYQLRPLKEVENYIIKYEHLPEVPSAQEVAKNGVDVGDNQALLLKKIEELTLYMIQQDKKIEQLQKELKQVQRSGL